MRMKVFTAISVLFQIITAAAWAQQGSVPPTVVVCRGSLDSAIDSSTAKPGQEVHIRLREGCKAPEFQLGKNTDLVVTVAGAKPAAPGQRSLLHLVFDRAVPEKGVAVPVIGIVQAVAPKNMRNLEGRNTVEAPAPAPVASGAGVGGTAAAAAMAAPTMSGSFGSYEGPADWYAELKTDATGVVGFKEFELQNDRSFPGTKLSSQKDFKLAAGTQVIIRAIKRLPQ